MKKLILIISATLLCISFTGCESYFKTLEDVSSAYQEQLEKVTGNETNDTTYVKNEQTQSDTSIESNTLKANEDTLNTKIMDDGYINGTNAQNIESSLKSIEEYNWWEDHTLTQSRINKEWSVYCANNESTTYTKSYDLSAHDTLEIEIAEFRTYDYDYDYLLLCASFFDTDLIDAEEVKEWIREYDKSKGTVEKTFGDAEFTMSYTEYDDGECYVEFSVWACGDINSN
ncbi:MAG: hypothetical protein IKT46_02725 [Clostridia bacterium]|nr:hypothetical protein [Clostridia bacterium]